MKETYIKPDIEIIALTIKMSSQPAILLIPMTMNFRSFVLEFVTAAVLTECGCYLIV